MFACERTCLIVSLNERTKSFFLPSLLRQEYSWGHLLVSDKTFAKISSSCNAFPALRDHVASFACKTSDQDEHFSVCDRRTYQTEDPSNVDQSYHGYDFSHSYINRKTNISKKSVISFDIQRDMDESVDVHSLFARWLFTNASTITRKRQLGS